MVPLPQACLPATGADQTLLIVLALGVAAVLLAAGVLAVAKTRGRVALVLIPIAALALVVGSAPKPAQALETAIPSFSFSDTWTMEQTLEDWSILSEDATGQALADMQTLEDMVVEGTAVKTFALTVSSSPDPADTYVFQVVPGFFDDFDFSYRIPGTGPNSLDTAITLLEDSTDLEAVLTFTYDYKDSCNRPLQTVVTYTGEFSAPQPVE